MQASPTSALNTLLRLASVVAALAAVFAPGARGVAASAAWNDAPHELTRLVSVQQTSPTSCGPAALATLSTWLGVPRTEAELLAIARVGPNGVTLSEFARLAHQIGLPGAWYQVPPARLGSLSTPFVAHLTTTEVGPDLGHLVTVAAVSHGYVVVADPATGAYVLSLKRFERRYSGRAYVLAEQP